MEAAKEVGELLDMRKCISYIILYILLAFVTVIMVLPLVWMFLTSLKDATELYVYPLIWIPKHLLWSNYTDVLEAVPFIRFIFNSIFVATTVTALQLIACGMGAYAFSRLTFPGRDKLFLLYLGTMMIPMQVTIIPMFLVFSHLKLIDTYWALIVPGIFSAYGTFLLRQFFMGVPRDLEESVWIDGGGYWRCFIQIIVPLSKPAFAALGTFTFLANWNNFMWPMLVTNQVKMKTLPVGITFFVGQYSIQWQLLMAAAAMSLLPMLTLYLFCQKYFVAGIALTGMKG